ncbi:MAG: DUF4838 domain-containing protein [Lentisphaeria bacterium]|nr:DUF4838 domain-containing protein [Lentisphaeria bacterium]
MKNFVKPSLVAALFLPLALFAEKSNFSHPYHRWGTWKTPKVTGKFAWNDSEGAASPGSVEITAGPQNKARGGLSFTKHFPGYAGKEYRASVMVKTVGLSPNARISMSFQGKGYKENFLGTNSPGVGKPGSDFADGKWHKLEYTLKVPADGKWKNTAWLLCCLTVSGAADGKVYFDDFSFEPVRIPLAKQFKMPEKCDPVKVVIDGKSGAAIIIPDSIFPVYPLAAKELAYHINKVSGVTLPVYRESEMPKDLKTRIWLGPCKQTADKGIDCEGFKPSGWAVCSIGGDIYIAGRDRSLYGTVASNWHADWQGTLYGVYAFLKNELGVRWLYPGEDGVVAPQTKNITYSGKVYTGSPKLMSSRLLNGSWEWIGWEDPAARKKFVDNQRQFLMRHGFQSVENINYSHNFGNYWKRFNKTHPEYFALVNPGNRKLLNGDKTGFQTPMCISNTGFHDQVVKDWISRAKKAFDARPFLSVMLNDTPEMCTCKDCRAWDYPDPHFKTSEYWAKGKVLAYNQRWQLSTAAWGEDGADGRGQPSLSDRYARFCLAIQEKARKYDPEVILMGYAYTNYVRPPKEVKLNKEIIIQNVFGLWYPYTKVQSQRFRANWEGWSKAGVRQIYRPNLLHAGANVPIFYGRGFAEDFRWAYQHGMMGSEMDSLFGSWGAQNANLYVICRMHENPDLSCDEIIDEYVKCFGKAAPVMRKYVALLEKYGEEYTAAKNEKAKKENRYKNRAGGTFMNYALISHEVTPLANIAALKALISEGRTAAKDEAAVLKYLNFIELGLLDAELTVKTRLAQIAMQKNNTPENKANFLKAFKELKDFRMAHQHDGAVNVGNAAFREYFGCGWPWKDNRKWNKKK